MTTQFSRNPEVSQNNSFVVKPAFPAYNRVGRTICYDVMYFLAHSRSSDVFHFILKSIFVSRILGHTSIMAATIVKSELHTTALPLVEKCIE